MSAVIPPAQLEFPLAPFDARGKRLHTGSSIRILSVESCAHDLPTEDRQRLHALINAQRNIIEFDRSGFVWLDSETANQSANFCLLPTELVLV
ncbi:hypothetical protein Q9Q94_15525 [Uliginosibacterium sp. 31-16]|uniref:hypothetical protein n=1 Tax=Uliginosibacterium sp. 31-16 TaxID=3068315 RepID=UPI00273EAB94|nr:hypothetical protein [Uliginosibacterium sp. 31-16]MDP5240952.1 hypothetical protein [Uliginosibacterium sp. 31-16]